MQPRYTQTPPGLTSGSTSATLRPRSAARNAAAYPPGPAPTTTSWTEVIRGLVRQVALVGRVGLSGSDPPAPPARPDPRDAWFTLGAPTGTDSRAPRTPSAGSGCRRRRQR